METWAVKPETNDHIVTSGCGKPNLLNHESDCPT